MTYADYQFLVATTPTMFYKVYLLRITLSFDTRRLSRLSRFNGTFYSQKILIYFVSEKEYLTRRSSSQLMLCMLDVPLVKVQATRTRRQP